MNMKKKIFKKHTKLFEDNIGGLLGNDGETLYISDFTIKSLRVHVK